MHDGMFLTLICREVAWRHKQLFVPLWLQTEGIVLGNSFVIEKFMPFSVYIKVCKIWVDMKEMLNEMN